MKPAAPVTKTHRDEAPAKEFDPPHSPCLIRNRMTSAATYQPHGGMKKVPRIQTATTSVTVHGLDLRGIAPTVLKVGSSLGRHEAQPPEFDYPQRGEKRLGFCMSFVLVNVIHSARDYLVRLVRCSIAEAELIGAWQEFHVLRECPPATCIVAGAFAAV